MVARLLIVTVPVKVRVPVVLVTPSIAAAAPVPTVVGPPTDSVLVEIMRPLTVSVPLKIAVLSVRLLLCVRVAPLLTVTAPAVTTTFTVTVPGEAMIAVSCEPGVLPPGPLPPTHPVQINGLFQFPPAATEVHVFAHV